MLHDARRALPGVDQLIQAEPLAALRGEWPHSVLADLARKILATERARLSGDGVDGDQRDIDDLALAMVALARQELQPTLHAVLNATGVILHTNLGRAPLSTAALEAVAAVAAGYTNLEYDEENGRRGSRHSHAEGLLCRVTSAEAACVVNNCAAGLVLVLAALARGKEVVVSRGQALEIGGGFRIPDVMRQSGAHLIDVGTTNRTRTADYAEAITPRTAALLRVHRSNFTQQGFVEDAPLAGMVDVAHRHGVIVVDDLGGGCLLDIRTVGLNGEPTVGESIAAGADLVLFSGDKLLGGPQAGVIVGRSGLIERVRRHSLMRALRVDKMTLAALQATLLHYVRGEAQREIPIWRMMSASQEELHTRCNQIAAYLRRDLEGHTGAGHVPISITVEDAVSAVGGGSLPGQTLPTTIVALGRPGRGAGRWATGLATALRMGSIAVDHPGGGRSCRLRPAHDLTGQRWYTCAGIERRFVCLHDRSVAGQGG